MAEIWILANQSNPKIEVQVKVEAEIVGQLAIHHAVGIWNDRVDFATNAHTVTHIESGCAVLHTENYEAARWFAEQAQDINFGVFDPYMWSFTIPSAR